MGTDTTKPKLEPVGISQAHVSNLRDMHLQLQEMSNSLAQMVANIPSSQECGPKQPVCGPGMPEVFDPSDRFRAVVGSMIQENQSINAQIKVVASKSLELEKKLENYKSKKPL